MGTIKHDGESVIKTHITTLKNGDKVPMTWDVDFTGCDESRIRELAAETIIIRTRNKTGVKELTTAEATAKYGTFHILVKDIAKIERVKHVQSEYEKKLEQRVRKLTSDGLSIPAAFKQAIAELDEEEMETGESA